MSDVVRDEESRSGAERRGEDRDVLRVGKLTRPFAVACSRTVDLNWDRAEEFFGQRSGLGELRGQVSADFFYGGLGQHQMQKAEITEDPKRRMPATSRN